MPPASEVTTDAVQYLAEQEQYQGEVAKGMFEPGEVVRTWAGGSLTVCVPGASPIVATFEGDRQFITLSLSWNRWRPEVCRYSLSSFSQAEAVARTGSKEWVEGRLQLEERCQVSLGT